MKKNVVSWKIERIFWKKEYKSKDKRLYEHIKELSPYITPEFLDIRQDFIENDMLESSICGKQNTRKRKMIFINSFYDYLCFS